jgi:hypothetical protein
MTSFSAKFATVRRVALAAVLAATAAATMLGLAGAAHAAPADGMYGNPTAAARYWQRQHESDCAEMSVADVVGEISGYEPTEQQIDAVAENTPSLVIAERSIRPPAALPFPTSRYCCCITASDPTATTTTISAGWSRIWPKDAR